MTSPLPDSRFAAAANPADERRAQLAAVIPEAFSEGRLDVAALKRALGDASVIESGERYRLDWADKSDAYRVLHPAPPPYNTGADSFICPYRFQESKEEYLRRIDELDDDGSLMREGAFRKNSRENGHYHSNWLSMMLPRLYVSRNLLREGGVIFVSCDDNAVHNLRCLDE